MRRGDSAVKSTDKSNTSVDVNECAVSMFTRCL
jgi:hypothetical protein